MLENGDWKLDIGVDYSHPSLEGRGIKGEGGNIPLTPVLSRQGRGSYPGTETGSCTDEITRK